MDNSVDAHSFPLLGHNRAAVNQEYNKVPLAEVRKVMELAYQQVMAEVDRLTVKPSQEAA